MAQTICGSKSTDYGTVTGNLLERGSSTTLNRPGFTGGQNSRRIARYGTDTKEEDLEAVFT
jgi:hypothetical protein